MDPIIGTMMGQVSRLLRRSFDERARSMGVTRPQWQVLSLLARHEGINQGGLAELLEVEPITLGRMIDRLQEAQLVERRNHPSDRRAWRLNLRPRGEDLIERMKPLARETLALAVDGLDEAEQRALLESLDRMRANLSRRAPVKVPVNG